MGIPSYVMIGTFLAVLAGIIYALVGLFRLRKSRRQITTTEEINLLSENLLTASSGILKKEEMERSEIVGNLSDEGLYQERHRQLSLPQIEAIAYTIRAEISEGAKKSLWRNAVVTFIVALIFFLLGYLLSKS